MGLGREIARHYVRAGADVFLTARGEGALVTTIEQLSIDTRPSQVVSGAVADVSSPDDCGTVVERAVAELPASQRLVLINNAGVYGPKGPIESVDWGDWVEAVEINLFGTVLMSRAMIPHMREGGGGKIVNLSGGGATAPLPLISAYAASKAAVVRMTETMALELRASRIDVNAIAPGALNTRLLDEVIGAGPEQVGDDFHERALKQRESGGTPPERGAELAVFLGSAASDGLTGLLLSAVWDDWRSLPKNLPALAGTDVYTLRRIVPEDRDLELSESMPQSPAS